MQLATKFMYLTNLLKISNNVKIQSKCHYIKYYFWGRNLIRFIVYLFFLDFFNLQSSVIWTSTLVFCCDTQLLALTESQISQRFLDSSSSIWFTVTFMRIIMIYSDDLDFFCIIKKNNFLSATVKRTKPHTHTRYLIL